MYSKNSPIDQSKFTQLIDVLGSLLYTNDITIDSRKVTENSIFCAYPGTTVDGRKFIESAINSGAKFIIWEEGIPFEYNIPNFPVKNLMLYVGLLSSAKNKYPSTQFKTIGLTGTNGKTSISHWLSFIYSQKTNTGIIGTTGAGIYPDIKYNDATTPDPLTLQSLMVDFKDRGANVVVMEVSSHSLIQGRVNGITFDTAIFTNLTQDHLDYHGDMESYYLAKRELFFWNGLKKAVINIDDEYGLRLYNELIKENKDVNCITYGIDKGDIKASNLVINLSGMTFDVYYKNEKAKVIVKVIGRFNVYNLLAVIATLLLDGFELGHAVMLLQSLKPVCGRMDAIIMSEKPLVVVDFSHTPDSLEKALTTLKEIEHTGKLYCVFGCGGNRDNTKRPKMGNTAASIADYTFVTSDNPRFEEPEAIIEQIKAGIKSDNYIAIPDRKMAIKAAIDAAKVGDIILIAGKGHETYQEIKGVKYPFSDFDIANEYLLTDR